MIPAYKLIKEYPGSPKLGTIMKWPTPSNEFPEFWEELKNPVKELVLISEDGQGLFVGDICFLIFHKSYSYSKEVMRRELRNPPIYMKYYASEEKVIEFCRLNKPMYSKKELLALNQYLPIFSVEPVIKVSDLQKLFDAKETKV